MITFKPFRDWYDSQMDGSRKKRRGDFLKECQVTPTRAQKIWEDRMPVKTDIIDKICEVYGLKVEQVIAFKHEDS
ncbi:DNA-binding Xre family transcriptional regulator [Paenibacillus sp. LBL]|uniref:hypothetical protein n=1 Tax=Paenibacillus TaxID=44249 RepID=UPI0024763E2C|nr:MULTISPECIES: hypothetical protein [Paenibacillus]MDH6674939.1 DNA-binding Xre family transcriptional regulator [Paenibacillus sp. LBL]MEC0204014.1 hypothetical protein [Paenibacillus lautus]